MKKLLLILMLLLLSYTGSIFAYQAGEVDTSFNVGMPLGFNSTVNALAVQGDGKIMVGGQFTIYSGFSANRIIRLNSDWVILKKDYCCSPIVWLHDSLHT